MLIGIPGRRAHLRFAVESVGASGKKLGAEAEFVFVRSKDDAGVQGDWAPVAVRAGSDSAWVLALPDPPSDLEAPRVAGRKLGAGEGGGGFLGIGHLSATALLCSGGGDVRTRDKAGLGAAGRGGRGVGAEEVVENKHAISSAVKAGGGASPRLPAGQGQILSDFGPAHLRLLRCILLLPLLL